MLRNGNVLHMSELDTAFNSIVKENGQDGADLFNLRRRRQYCRRKSKMMFVTKVSIGFELFTVFVKGQVETGKEMQWSPMKKTEAAQMENHRKEDQGDC